uniref:Uncharacterized protein n=1 Tax=Magallana gigas TaxID=29159 RepID=A0A8W8LB88_MAGGI|nr:uncharacterized protein LOC105347437 isoform X3 [Crassostrea gigas]XP_034310939.1 uncharacterized protein LOC105347437 isoform X3 [Crassostrea gigas]|eukprot:XP_019930563.1 PREDICTED: uncharacterized protein LOC105347437 isoform X3 [Crassostrea gigas]
MYKLRLRQSYLSFGAFGCYGVSLLFFIICFCSNHWWYLQLDGKVINMGLWTGCWSSTSGESKCSSSIFDDKHFQNGGGSDWYHGARILMTCSLIAIFLQEFALIGYLCINEVEKYRQKLAGAVLGFSAVIVLFTALVLAMISTEAAKLEGGRLGWSFDLAGVNIIPCTCVVALVYLELYYRNHKQSCLNIGE